MHRKRKEILSGIELHDNVNQILVATNMALSMTKSNPQKIQETNNFFMEHIPGGNTGKQENCPCVCGA